MHRSTRTPIVLASTGVVLALALTGCSSGGTDTAPTATETVTASAGGSSPSTATSAPSSSSAASSSSGGSAGGGSGGDGGRCTTGSLSGSVESGSGGAAGSTYVHLALRNTGSTTCTLQGWPGVSFVGGGSGEQIGAPATRDEASAHPTVTLAPGAVAVAPLRITQAENYPTATCDPVSADGFRVYPPGSTESLFVRDSGITACRSTDAGLLSVQGLVPEGQAAD
ncbi:DUF4232 domain-containing protein [Curtobacterium sp. ODYSSEY 48 V2]|uniref:DUF4232 domain-containing protein n=1 Tax=unclassified Curtobacterium TaxID=257496 RepID=UPI00203EDCCE|nr:MULTISPECIES: DUF4232 domain-containing protein [unclassified Curtobacterium]MCM3503909.1 DUF4232 domain-containing protein [Curtobacterium sp. ODYSSEY 48 V2]MDB6426306.1 DUF4232 domain-containing protein [Curtobacterium sp. 20TX0008]